MKRILLLCILSLLLTLPALAVEEGGETGTDETTDPIAVETITKEEEGVTVNVTIQQPETAAPDLEAVVEGTDPAGENPPAARTFSSVTPDVSEAVPSEDAPATMARAVTAVLGEYQRKTMTVQETDAEGNVVSTSTEYVPGLAGLDYPWIAGAVLFTVFILGIFKLLGGLIRS